MTIVVEEEKKYIMIYGKKFGQVISDMIPSNSKDKIPDEFSKP